MKRHICKIATGLLICLCAFGFLGTQQVEAAKKKTATISVKSIKVGQRETISTNIKKPTFKSSNSSIACVNEDGIITGKKAGKVTIKVKGKGVTRKIQLKVKARKYKPTISVALDEITYTAELKKNAQGNYIYSMRVKNNAKKGTVQKMEYVYRVQTEATVWKNVVLTIPTVTAGQESEVATCVGDYSGNAANMQLQEVRLYTGEALHRYNAQTGDYSLSWGVADTTAPTFSGWIKKKSYNKNQPYLLCYADQKEEYNFLDYVSAEDERDKNVSITVDQSAVNWKKAGKYKVWFTACDQAGNTAKTWMKIQVLLPGEAEELADDVLADIIKEKWSDERKARAIYKFVRDNVSYVDRDRHVNWRQVGINGILYGSGDCFTFYSVSRLLLTRARIPNVMVKRNPSQPNHRHWWNLAYVEDGWYHFDSTPTRTGQKLCLITDKQAKKLGAYLKFDKSLYPTRSKKRISPNP